MLIDRLMTLITVCSILHTTLPPWDWNPDFVKNGLSEFPAAQRMIYCTFNNKYYRLLIYIIGFIAINGRSTVWHVISVANPTGANANLTTIEKQARTDATDIIVAANTAAGVPASLNTGGK